jgi:hypothetical protein
MLMGRVRSGQIEIVELASGGRRHAEWIDHWVAECPTKWLLMLDSDVEIRSDDWLAAMVSAAMDSGAAMSMASLLPENPNYSDPFDGHPVRLGRRPSMHCLLLDVAQVRSVRRSFASMDESSDAGHPIHYDIGGWVMAGLANRTVVMPEGWEASALRHYRALSWARQMTGDRRRHYLRTQPIVTARLAVYRAAGRRGADGLKHLARVRRAIRS